MVHGPTVAYQKSPYAQTCFWALYSFHFVYLSISAPCHMTSKPLVGKPPYFLLLQGSVCHLCPLYFLDGRFIVLGTLGDVF